MSALEPQAPHPQISSMPSPIVSEHPSAPSLKSAAEAGTTKRTGVMTSRFNANFKRRMNASNIDKSPQTVDSPTSLLVQGSNAAKTNALVNAWVKAKPTKLKMTNENNNQINSGNGKLQESPENSPRGQITKKNAFGKERVAQSVLSASENRIKLDESVKAARALANPMEAIANTAKNLMDHIDFSIPKGETAKSVADKLLTDLKEAQTLVPPMSQFRGKPVEEKNRVSMNQLLDRAQKHEDALLEVIESKQSRKEGKVHFCKPILNAIGSMQNKNDAERIATFMMSEVCVGGGGTRELDLKNFNALLKDEKIRSSPLLKNAVIKAGQAVQLQAIRKTQIKIAMELFKKQKPKEWRQDIEKFEQHMEGKKVEGGYVGGKYTVMEKTTTEEFLKSSFNTKNQDLAGIVQIATEAGLELQIPDQADSHPPIKELPILERPLFSGIDDLIRLNGSLQSIDQ